MSISRTYHPPAVVVALLAGGLGGDVSPLPHSLIHPTTPFLTFFSQGITGRGWFFLAYPVLVSCVIMLLCGLIINNAYTDVQYPVRWR